MSSIVTDMCPVSKRAGAVVSEGRLNSKSAPQRADAQRNRERILEVALKELTRSVGTSLSLIAKEAGVGQATFYRNFPNREALVFEIYRHETQQLAESAAELLTTNDPDRALREWMDRLAEYAMTKTGLAMAIRQVATAPVTDANPAYPSIVAAVDLLLRANEAAGTIRPGLTTDDFIIAIAGLWQIDPRTDWRPKATRLLNLVMDGLRVGALGADPTSRGVQRPTRRSQSSQTPPRQSHGRKRSV